VGNDGVVRPQADTKARRTLVSTLGVVAAALAVVVAVMAFADGRLVFGVVWSAIAVWWFVYAVFLSRLRKAEGR
jgi:hypothetical protein